VRAVFLTFSLLFLTFSSSHVAAQALSKEQKQAVDQAIETYIQNNPDKIIQSLEQHQQDQMAERARQEAENLEKNIAYLSAENHPTAGNAQGDVTVVEFFDYNCGYCKRAFQDLQILLESDENVNIVFVEMPILGPSSLLTAKWSLAAAKQDKYFDYHAALMKFSGKKNEQSLSAVAESAGLDVQQLKLDAQSPEISEQIQKNVEIARQIGVNGTPGFVINGEIFKGYLGYEGLKGVIDEARANEEQG
jgi:protein-disulfide isomerase